MWNDDDDYDDDDGPEMNPWLSLFFFVFVNHFYQVGSAIVYEFLLNIQNNHKNRKKIDKCLMA